MRPSVAASDELSRKLFDRLESEPGSTHNPASPWSVANLAHNQNLNRWCNVLPYDSARVKLASSSEADYINASRVLAPGLDDKAYILTQGPLAETVGHFWTMIWQQQVSAIVMLCRLVESGASKCARYWPESEEDDDLIHVAAERGLEVRLRDVDHVDSDTLIRSLELRHCATDSIRVITQYHYLTWPDFGVPSSTSAFLRFLHTVNAKHPSTSESPLVIHCSAGIGRSGTFILVDACIDRMKHAKKPLSRSQIIETLGKMRTMRAGLVQTSEQLKFSLQAIEDAMKLMEFEPDEQQPVVTNGVASRKRSTDGGGIGTEESPDSDNGLLHEHSNNVPPKRPKANC